eukprot:10553518-Karenia_brevis.AAC.1
MPCPYHGETKILGGCWRFALPLVPISRHIEEKLPCGPHLFASPASAQKQTGIVRSWSRCFHRASEQERSGNDGASDQVSLMEGLIADVSAELSADSGTVAGVTISPLAVN